MAKGALAVQNIYEEEQQYEVTNFYLTEEEAKSLAGFGSKRDYPTYNALLDEDRRSY